MTPFHSPVWFTPAIHRLIDLALEEDLGRGDITTWAVVDSGIQGRGRVVAREPAVVAGLDVALEIFRRVDSHCRVTPQAQDGDRLAAGATLLNVVGPARGILMAERTVLNFLQRLSGIATLTRMFVDAAGGSPARVTDTRKTSPGARALEKLAVRAGGGSNHRHDLGGGILIKDNHIAVAGSVRSAVARARTGSPHGFKIEVEVDTLLQLDEALAEAADIILLDNFALADVYEAVARARRRTPRPLLEVSGGVKLENLPALAATGVDIISVGALTHSARAVDLSLDLELS